MNANYMIAVLLIVPTVLHAVNTNEIPDLTRVRPENTKRVFNLGPTGMQGLMHVDRSRLVPGDIEPTPSTARARQILITAVDTGSPADGVIAPGDVILGVGDRPFRTDPRLALADAINTAETEAQAGQLRLLRWRPDAPDNQRTRPPGKTNTVTLTLRVMGAYSQTAPYDCPKSEAILQQTIASMLARNRNNKLDLPYLALLATGEEAHVEAATRYIRKVGKPGTKLGRSALEQGSAWNWGYRLILLCEYYLMTGDETVLPAIREYAVTLSMGQSLAGNWGHHMARPSFNDGRLHGRLSGYAALNQPSLTCYLGLVLADKCGIAHPELTAALENATTYFRYYVGKSAIPYGYHPPPEYLQTNNGTSGSAALAFAMQGDHVAARFFARLCAGAHAKLEMGHTGTFFNTLWTGLGAQLAGPEVYAGFFQQWTWLRTLARKWDGGFVYQTPGGDLKGYRGLDPDAAMILHYSLPRRALLITGREPDKSLWLEGEAAEAAVAVWDIDYGEKNNDELLGLLGHAVPLVRSRAADTLSTRADILPSLLDALNGSRNAKIGACHALDRMQAAAAPALEALMALVLDPDEDRWVRSRAAIAVAATGTAALPYGPDLLALVAREHPGDARRDFERELAQAALRVVQRPGFDKTAHQALIDDAAATLLGHPHHTARYYGMKLIEDLPLADFHRFAERIQAVILNDDPAYSVYHADAARQAGLRLLDKLNIQKGIELAIRTIEPDTWGQRYRIDGKNGRLEQLRRYGANVKPYIPQLQETLGPKADALVADIQAATHTRELITMQTAIETGSQPAPRVPGEGLSPMQITHQVQASLERVRNACVAVRWRASGVIISPDGYILTAGHVAASAMKSKKPIRVHLADGRRANVTFVGWDKSSDLALLKITDETVAWPYVPLADRVPDGPAIVFHYAHTGGYQKDRPAQLRIGRIRTRSMAGDQTRFILSDISVQPGDSGGPLFDIDGRLIGFCTSAGPIGVNQFSAIDNFHAGREDLMAGKRWGDPADAALGTTPQTIDRAARQRIMAEFKRRIKDQYAPVMDMVLEKTAGGARAEIGFDAIMQNMGVDGVMIVQEGALAYGLDDPALVRQLGKLPAGSVLPLVIAADGQPISYGLPVTATHVVAKQSEIDNDADLTLRVAAGNPVALAPVASDPTWDLVLLQVAADHKLTPLQWPQEPVEIKAGTGLMSPDTKGRLCWGVASDQRRPITKPGAVGPMLDTARVSAYRAPYPSIIRHHLPLFAADAGRPVYTLDGRFVGLHMGRISRTLGLILDSQDIRRSVDRMLADQAKALVRSNDN